MLTLYLHYNLNPRDIHKGNPGLAGEADISEATRAFSASCFSPSNQILPCSLISASSPHPSHQDVATVFLGHLLFSFVYGVVPYVEVSLATILNYN